jgi:hypothetical protein
MDKALEQEIDKAIAAHASWKIRLRSALNGGDIPDPSKVGLDDQCDFGKWLVVSAAKLKGDSHFQAIKQLHARFHTAAAGVCSDIRAKKPDAAKHAMDVGGPFTSASADLTRAMMEWKKTG